MKCFYCESEIEEKVNFCSNCGEKNDVWRAKEKERLQKIIDEPDVCENLVEENDEDFVKTATEALEQTERKIKAMERYLHLMGLGTYTFKDFLTDAKEDWVESFKESGIKESWVEVKESFVDLVGEVKKDVKNMFRRKKCA